MFRQIGFSSLPVAFGIIWMPTGFVYKIVFEDYNIVWPTTGVEGAP